MFDSLIDGLVIGVVIVFTILYVTFELKVFRFRLINSQYSSELNLKVQLNDI